MIKRNTMTRNKISCFDFPFNFIKNTYDVSDKQVESYIIAYLDEGQDIFATFMYYYHCLPERDRRIIEARFRDKKTYKDIAETEGISQSRIMQILFKAERKMRESVSFYDLQRGKRQIENEKNKEITRLKAGEVLCNKSENSLSEKSLFDFVSFANLSSRASSCLYKLGVRKIRDITEITKEEILNSSNCGRKTAEEIEYAMLSIGLDLKRG